jgi:hypothetical protein
MNRSLIVGVLVAAAITLGTVYAYNRFSGRSISDLGKK